MTASDPPLVSCIMPTCDRRALVPHAIARFLRQAYAPRELVIVDDGADAIADLVPDDPRVRYVRLKRRVALGAKRNIACELARGAIVAHWDDDDWYPDWRLAAQVEALGDPEAALTGSRAAFFYEPATARAWLYESPEGEPLLVGATLAYKRSHWESRRFPEIQVGEDLAFQRSAPPRAVRASGDPALCVATIHSTNTSRRRTRGASWREASALEIHARAGGAIESLGAAFARAPVAPVRAPLVSCIMPTANRRAFVRLAVEAFGRQDYANRELIVVDDGDEAIADLLLPDPRIRHVRLGARASIGAKRNLACAEARGEIVLHWDDDDWYAPSRISSQVAPIAAGRADVTGLDNRYVLTLPSGDFWASQPELHRRMFVGDVHGGTLAYRRSLLANGARYPNVDLAEDAALLRAILARGARLVRVPNDELFVYVRHRRNAWAFEAGRFLDPAGWLRITRPAAMTPSLVAAYAAAADEAIAGSWCAGAGLRR